MCSFRPNKDGNIRAEEKSTDDATMKAKQKRVIDASPVVNITRINLSFWFFQVP